MQQLNHVAVNNDYQQLLTEKDRSLNNSERVLGFIQGYQIQIINKLNQVSTKMLLWVLNLEIFLSTFLLGLIYFKNRESGQFSIFPHFTLFFIIVESFEMFLRIYTSYQVRDEALQFYSKQLKFLSNSVGIEENETKSILELNPMWSILQLETFYTAYLCEKLDEYISKMMEYDERINENQGSVIVHQSIQLVFSFIKFRQVYLNMKLCLFLIFINNFTDQDQYLTIIIILYITFLECLNIWINFHLAVVYLFYRQSYLSCKDIMLLLGEIVLKCIHSLSFFYVLTNIDDILPYFSIFFLATCTVYGICITIQVNSLFDSSNYSVFDLIFLGYSTNYYIGLKHREYFINKIGYQYKTDILKQIFIFFVQLAMILYYYQRNQSISNRKILFIKSTVCILAILLRIIVILIKFNYYLKPKSLLFRLRNFQGSTQFIEEIFTKTLDLKSLNGLQQDQQEIEKQKLDRELQIINPIEEVFNNKIGQYEDTNHMKIQFSSFKRIQLQKEIKIKEILNQKIEQIQYKMIFYTESKISEFEQNLDIKCILQELVKYTKSELIFLISNQIKIWNQYGHIDILIHKYESNLLRFIEKYITPYSQSIQIDSCYKDNSDAQIQLMLLYNIINKELDINSKITLKPFDLVQSLPIPKIRKINYLILVNKICNAKTISLLKIISFNKYISSLLYQNNCQVLYDLYDNDND